MPETIHGVHGSVQSAPSLLALARRDEVVYVETGHKDLTCDVAVRTDSAGGVEATSYANDGSLGTPATYTPGQSLPQITASTGPTGSPP